jgi:hypothetical protein
MKIFWAHFDNLKTFIFWPHFENFLGSLKIFKNVGYIFEIFWAYFQKSLENLSNLAG